MLSPNDVLTVPALSKLFKDGYRLSAIYTYTALDGKELYWRVRLEHESKNKEIRPLYLAAGDVLDIGEPQASKSSLKPLYGLHLTSLYDTAHIWIVEGEKCTDSLNAHFHLLGQQSKHVALTSGSATSADKADWQPLSCRSVTIWPDNDVHGQNYALAVMKKLKSIGCQVECIAADSFGLDEGGDCADWLQPLAAD